MVLGIAMMSAMLPTMIGLNEATKGSRDREESHKKDSLNTRTHLIATCDVDEGSQTQRQQVHNAKVYLGLHGKVLYPEMKHRNGILANNLRSTFPKTQIIPCPHSMDTSITILLLKKITLRDLSQ